MDAIIKAVESLMASWAGIAVILATVVATVISVASVIVKITKTQKDDDALNKFIKLMRLLGLYT